ncbi:MAG: transposase [Burkholderiaceae bacterium]
MLSLPIPLRLLLAAQPVLVTPVLQLVHRVITRHLLEQTGLRADEAPSGAVTLMQRFGSAANLNFHLHCLVLDGVYRRTDGEPVFVLADSPIDEALQALPHKIITRLMKLLTRRGVFVEEEEGGSSYLSDAKAKSDEVRSLRPLEAAACTYRIAFGPRAGQKEFTVQGAMARDAVLTQALCADHQGFSLHAAVRLRCLRAPAAGAPLPVHHASGAGQRMRVMQRLQTGGGADTWWCSRSRRHGATGPRTLLFCRCCTCCAGRRSVSLEGAIANWSSLQRRPYPRNRFRHPCIHRHLQHQLSSDVVHARAGISGRPPASTTATGSRARSDAACVSRVTLAVACGVCPLGRTITPVESSHRKD